jgi:hypothetical protein
MFGHISSCRIAVVLYMGAQPLRILALAGGLEDARAIAEAFDGLLQVPVRDGTVFGAHNIKLIEVPSYLAVVQDDEPTYTILDVLVRRDRTPADPPPARSTVVLQGECDCGLCVDWAQPAVDDDKEDWYDQPPLTLGQRAKLDAIATAERALAATRAFVIDRSPENREAMEAMERALDRAQQEL